MKIGILPNSQNLNHPQDRRRYLPFFKKNNVEFEIADFNKLYDILYISLNCDLNLWSLYKKKFSNNKIRIIFDLSDNYLVDNFFISFLRSIGHFLTGRTKFLRFDYRKSILDILKISDVVTVGSKEQKDYLSKYTNSQIIIINDNFEEFDNLIIEKKPLINHSINILWEGYSHSLFYIARFIKEILVKSKKVINKDINLYVVSDCIMCRYFARFFCSSTEQFLVKKFGKTGIKIFFKEWNTHNLVLFSSICHFAIIPLTRERLFSQKPENKILLYWKLKIPVVVSSIPSYKRIMTVTNNDIFCCDNVNMWINSINYMSQKSFSIEKYFNGISNYYNDIIAKDDYNRKWNLIFYGE